jgi:hypothetical protein
MVLVVLLVRLLNPEGASDTATVFIASLAYSEQVRLIQAEGLGPERRWQQQLLRLFRPAPVCSTRGSQGSRLLRLEGGARQGGCRSECLNDASPATRGACWPRPQEGDSTGQRLGGALLNALIFVCVVAAMTFVLFFLFKYKVWECRVELPAGAAAGSRQPGEWCIAAQGSICRANSCAAVAAGGIEEPACVCPELSSEARLRPAHAPLSTKPNPHLHTRCQCYKAIYAYMGFAVFDMFFVLTGAVVVRLLQVCRGGGPGAGWLGGAPEAGDPGDTCRCRTASLL